MRELARLFFAAVDTPTFVLVLIGVILACVLAP